MANYLSIAKRDVPRYVCVCVYFFPFSALQLGRIAWCYMSNQTRKKIFDIVLETHAKTLQKNTIQPARLEKEKNSHTKRKIRANARSLNAKKKTNQDMNAFPHALIYNCIF